MYTIFIISFSILQQWEGLIELLGSEVGNAGGLEFLHKLAFFFPFPLSWFYIEYIVILLGFNIFQSA